MRLLYDKEQQEDMPMMLREFYQVLKDEGASSLFDGNLLGALAAFRSYIAKIPYDIITKEEWDDKESHEVRCKHFLRSPEHRALASRL